MCSILLESTIFGKRDKGKGEDEKDETQYRAGYHSKLATLELSGTGRLIA